jgi:hypothetical protein
MSDRAVATVETDRFAKLLRLALGSDKDGEIIGAVVALKRSLAAAELDTHWIVDAFERGAAPVINVDDRDRDDDRSKAWFAWHRRFLLSAKEQLFVERVVSWRGPLSVKQRKWLNDIVGKLEEVAP